MTQKKSDETEEFSWTPSARVQLQQLRQAEAEKRRRDWMRIAQLVALIFFGTLTLWFFAK